MSVPFGGVFFSTFYGGHDTTWGPTSTQHAYFADFSLLTTVQH
ncbi:polysaccharide lyase [Kitasatospora sp. NPDC088351]